MDEEKERIIIIGGGSTKELGNEILVKCKKCGQKTTLTKDNIKRHKQKGVEVYCNPCGRKILENTNEPKTVTLPSQASVDKRFEQIMLKKFINEFVKKTLYCKTCKAELGHDTLQGLLLNKSKVGHKNPNKSIELKDLGIKIKTVKGTPKKFLDEKAPETGKMVS